MITATETQTVLLDHVDMRMVTATADLIAMLCSSTRTIPAFETMSIAPAATRSLRLP